MYAIIAMDEKKKQHYALDDTLCVNTQRLNGDNITTFDIEATENNMELISKIDKRWFIKIVSGHTETLYVVQNIYEQTFGDSMYISVDTLFEPHDRLKHEMKYETHSGSKTRDEWFNWVFSGSSIKLEMQASPQYAISIESFGMDSRLSLFYELLDKYQLEYYFVDNGNTIIVVDKIGEDKSDYVSYGVNMIELSRTRQMSGFGTYGEIFGAYIDEEKPELGRYHQTYTSPLADHYGKIPIKPISDERFKIKENMIDAVKTAVERSIVVTVEVSFDELTFERDGGWVGVGDSIMLIDERLGMFNPIRVFEINTTTNYLGEIIAIEYTLGDYDEHYKSQTEDISFPKQISGKFKDLLAETKYLQNDIDTAIAQAGRAGKIYRQKLRPMGDDLQQGDLWYQQVWNSSKGRYETRMHQYEKEGAIGKWVEVIDVQLGDADNLERGTINAKVINLVNLNADEIVTGTVRGRNLKIDLDRGLVEFQRGKIYKADDSFVIDIDNGTISSKSPLTGNWFNLKRGEIEISTTIGGIGKTMGRIGQSKHLTSGYSLIVEGIDTVNVGTLNSKPSSNIIEGTGAGYRAHAVDDDGNPTLGRSVMFADNEVQMCTNDVATKKAVMSISKNNANIRTSGKSHQSIVMNTATSEGGTSSITISAGTSKGIVTGGGYDSKGYLNLNSTYAMSLAPREDLNMRSNKITLSGPTRVIGGLDVSGKKNAIHVTRDGIRETPAYETAVAYIGDIGEVTTNDECIAKVEIPELMYDIVNFDMDYQVFVTPYDFCQVRVRDRKSTHFIIETDKPNCTIGYEYKGRRRGYEDEWLCEYPTNEKSFMDIAYPEHDKYKREMTDVNRMLVVENVE